MLPLFSLGQGMEEFNQIFCSRTSFSKAYPFVMSLYQQLCLFYHFFENVYLSLYEVFKLGSLSGSLKDNVKLIL